MLEGEEIRIPGMRSMILDQTTVILGVFHYVEYFIQQAFAVSQLCCRGAGHLCEGV